MRRALLLLPPLAALAGCGGNANAPGVGGSSAFANDLGTGAPAARAKEKPEPLAELGDNADLKGGLPGTLDGPWRRSVDTVPAGAKLAVEGPLTLGFGEKSGYVYRVVSTKDKKVAVTFPKGNLTGELPIPDKAEGTLLLLERETGKTVEIKGLAEKDGKWIGERSARHDLRTGGKIGQPLSVSGLPLFAGLVRADETLGVKAIGHALAFSAPNLGDGVVPGQRVRLREDFDARTLSPAAQVVVNALKRYGMVAVDKGPFALLGTKDAKWKEAGLTPLSTLTGADFVLVSPFGKEPKPVAPKRTPPAPAKK